MRNALNEEEMRELQSLVEGINPEGLAKVVRHSIHRIGKNVHGEFGIHFTQLEEEAAGAVPMAIFWQDSNPSQHMSRKMFLSILEFVAEQAIDEHDSENSAMSAGVKKLETALEALKKEISAMPSMTYNDRYDSGFMESVESGTWTIQELPSPLTEAWESTDLDDVFVAETTQQRERQYPLYHRNEQKRRHSSSRGRGIEGVVERLPELRIRYESVQSSNSSGRALRRVRERLRTVNILRGSNMSPLVDEGASAPILGLK